MNNPHSVPDNQDCCPHPALIYRNHAIVLLPRDDKWEVRIIYISPVCLAPLFSTHADAFAQGKKEADADS